MVVTKIHWVDLDWKDVAEVTETGSGYDNGGHVMDVFMKKLMEITEEVMIVATVETHVVVVASYSSDSGYRSGEVTGSATGAATVTGSAIVVIKQLVVVVSEKTVIVDIKRYYDGAMMMIGWSKMK
ncbi:hypothetical protein IGI04_021936 [Brassica rapa subsp. trilocularis]|nr:hypothetical protein IGI04_021936 [Brassica rapa subsp. trilocularis]